MGGLRRREISFSICSKVTQCSSTYRKRVIIYSCPDADSQCFFWCGYAFWNTPILLPFLDAILSWKTEHNKVILTVGSWCSSVSVLSPCFKYCTRNNMFSKHRHPLTHEQVVLEKRMPLLGDMCARPKGKACVIVSCASCCGRGSTEIQCWKWKGLYSHTQATAAKSWPTVDQVRDENALPPRS